MSRQTRTMLLPGLGAEHVDSVKAIRAVKARASAGIRRLADVAVAAVKDLAASRIKDINDAAAGRISANTVLIEANTARIAELTAGRDANEYITEKSREVIEGVAKVQAMLSNFLRGLLPSGSLPNWRRGIWTLALLAISVSACGQATFRDGKLVIKTEPVRAPVVVEK